ncbi:hypothetical protein [Paenibacillus flagellatus]|uniref:hypothetical protein n=1 Tax=Paenibacillus flagellatus TaxID=2211139 RepID=UPI0011B6FE9E|nr:hypothetical protein [Paenibacillus flagellatus]
MKLLERPSVKGLIGELNDFITNVQSESDEEDKTVSTYVERLKVILQKYVAEQEVIDREGEITSES